MTTTFTAMNATVSSCGGPSVPEERFFEGDYPAAMMKRGFV